MQEVFEALLLRKLNHDPQFIHDIILELGDHETLADGPEFSKGKDVCVAVFGIEVNLLSVEPMNEETEAINVDIGEAHGLGRAFGELAVEGCGEEWGVVTDDLFVDDESLLRLLGANGNCHHALRTSMYLSALMQVAPGAVGSPCLRLGAFFSETSGLIVRIPVDCDSSCMSPTMVEEGAGDGVVVFVVVISRVFVRRSDSLFS
ncbi:uncharacterized protein K444DRAFT_626602 [Hyaloscypha bicolor E]|uniref:Uncharacterized protein n=1 Tax=Hyaloscypha bicolor E TaxID=1095630 RepID=A0A2J6TKH4_9HELO|nr:uncharacterized protein K444DRAFT_626602 [Hyaloscypha bicolor E]PMD63523.1 hypothetical protein K444DRAFT_626602 [Hyaloscypha bicolor E]